MADLFSNVKRIVKSIEKDEGIRERPADLRRVRLN